MTYQMKSKEHLFSPNLLEVGGTTVFLKILLETSSNENLGFTGTGIKIEKTKSF